MVVGLLDVVGLAVVVSLLDVVSLFEVVILLVVVTACFIFNATFPLPFPLASSGMPPRYACLSVEVMSEKALCTILKVSRPAD